MATKKSAKPTPPAGAAPDVPARAPAKKTAKPAAKKAPARKAARKKKAAGAQPSPDAIARAAYLNYRRRVEDGLPGDQHTDWLEAERSLGNAPGD